MINYFENKKPVREKLLKFGFKKEGDIFIYNKNILDNQFKLEIITDDKGKITTKLTELETDELYTLHLIESASGDFVGKIREEYNKIMENIALECFEYDVFKNKQTIELIKYIKEKYNDKLEFLWEKFPKNAIVRRKDNSKWYCIFLTISKQKLGFKENESVEIIDLRTQNAAEIIDNKFILPAYHMNKKSWFTIILDNSLSSGTIKTKIDESYQLAKKKKIH